MEVVALAGNIPAALVTGIMTGSEVHDLFTSPRTSLMPHRLAARLRTIRAALNPTSRQGSGSLEKLQMPRLWWLAAGRRATRRKCRDRASGRGPHRHTFADAACQGREAPKEGTAWRHPAP